MIILQLDNEQLSSLMQSAVRKVINETPIEPSILLEQETLLTVQDAAKFLSLSVPTIYALISKGELPVMKRSKRCYFSKEDLINYIKAGRKKTNDEMNQEAMLYSKKKLQVS